MNAGSMRIAATRFFGCCAPSAAPPPSDERDAGAAGVQAKLNTAQTSARTTSEQRFTAPFRVRSGSVDPVARASSACSCLPERAPRRGLLVHDRCLVRHHDLALRRRRLQDAEADFERGFAPAPVVKHGFAFDDRFVELGDLCLATEEDVSDRYLSDRLVTIDENAILGLPHVPPLACDDRQAIEALVAHGVRPRSMFPPTIVRSGVAPVFTAAGARTA